MSTVQHKIQIEGPPGDLRAQVWRCSCGMWESTVPKVGAYGHSTAKARIAQVQMAHGKHVKGAIKAAKTNQESKA